MDYDDVLNIWGRELLEERGYKVKEDTEISVEIVTDTFGGCETCSYEETNIIISMGRDRCSIDTYLFKDILLKLVEVAANNSSS